MADRKLQVRKKRAAEVISLLRGEYPDVKCALIYTQPHELLIATRLSAQCTDKRVNMVTPALFGRFRSIDEFAAADSAEVGEYIRTCGLYKTKAADIVNMCVMLRDVYGRQSAGQHRGAGEAAGSRAQDRKSDSRRPVRQACNGVRYACYPAVEPAGTGGFHGRGGGRATAPGGSSAGGRSYVLPPAGAPRQGHLRGEGAEVRGLRAAERLSEQG